MKLFSVCLLCGADESRHLVQRAFAHMWNYGAELRVPMWDTRQWSPLKIGTNAIQQAHVCEHGSTRISNTTCYTCRKKEKRGNGYM